jgi:uncharacterized protein YhdP
MQGGLVFSESDFQLDQFSAQLLGGRVHLAGGIDRQQDLRIQGFGTLPVGTLWSRATGEARYEITATQASTRTTNTENFRIDLRSSLQGVGLDVPAPFKKTAPTAMPLHVMWTPKTQTIDATLGDIAALQHNYSNAPYSSLRIGASAVNQYVHPQHQRFLIIDLPNLDVDAWGALLPLRSANADTSGGTTMPTPTSAMLRIGELRVGGRTFQNVVAGASLYNGTWRMNLDAKEMNGYLEYQQGTTPAKLYGRLARLNIPASDLQQATRLLDIPSEHIPSVDVVVEDLEWASKRLGRLDLQAIHQKSSTQLDGALARSEWRLQQLDLTMPEAKLQSTGVWSSAPQRTTLSAQLDIQDAGALLKRLQYPDVVKSGAGKLQAKITWQGAPWQMDFPSMNGQLRMDISSGQFLKIEPGVGRLLSVLSLQALPRRLSLDFRDVFGQGFAFDRFAGDVTVMNGIAATNNLQMKGVLATADIQGQSDLSKETQSLTVKVTPDLNAGGASVLASIFNPVIGAATFITQWVLRRPLNQANTKIYNINGTWQHPMSTEIKSPE